MHRYIWLFGENLGATTNNNSFYMWQHVLKYDDEIDKKFILENNKKNKDFFKTLSKKEQENIIWKNSKKHWEYYYKADMFFVTLSYKDVIPSRILLKQIKLKLKTPTIYLQHGTTAIKKLGYSGTCYNNNMFRFVYYNPQIKKDLINENKFKEYQLYFGEYHPRYKELIRRNDELYKDENQILWFLTWREYFGENKETDEWLQNVKKVLENKKLNEFLQINNKKLKICLHQFFDNEKRQYLLKNIPQEIVEIVTPTQVDVMDELAKSSLLITDYSSVGFDFTLLGKPVIMYQPDLQEYSKGREFYCSIDELNKYNIKTISGLVKEITSGDYKINKFYKDRTINEINYEYIRQGKHIDKMYEYFADLQKKDITFIGYNYYGKGGTVSATKALAEALLEKGYLVKLLSLKKTGKVEAFPDGLNVTSLYTAKGRTITELPKRLFISKRHYGDLKYDPNCKRLLPYTGYALRKKLEKINSHVVVSTRETLHPFLKKATSPMIEKKVYFFHTAPNIVADEYISLVPILKEIRAENAVFITENSRRGYIEVLNYDNYDKYTVIGNCLTSNMMIKKEDILPIEPKKAYKGIYLVRMSKDREETLNNVLNFGKYLKENSIKGIMIDVFGKGDYAKEFEHRIEEMQVEKYIKYNGATDEPNKEIKEHDFVIDFSFQQSFGMTYIESILNGKMVFAFENEGSLEVLRDIPECFVKDYKELVDKIKRLSEIKVLKLRENYDKISNRYSRDVVSNKFLDFLEQK